MTKRLLRILLCILTIYFLIPTNAFAETSAQESNADFFRPVRVAIVLDSSGSIIESHMGADTGSRIAAKNFVSLLPVHFSEVAVFSYNYSCKKEKDLTKIDNQDVWKKLGDDIISLKQFGGGTAMLDATKAAREYLESTPSDMEDSVDVIVLFTDGSETEKLSKRTATDGSINACVQEARGNSDIDIYSVAFDYIYEDGSHSISGENGEGYGKKLLDRLCGKPENVLVVQNSAEELSDEFQKIIHKLTHSPKGDTSIVLESDGQMHDVQLMIPKQVAEANIRISCNTPEAVINKQITLKDPEGKIVPFSVDTNSNCWYSADSMGINIKLLEPEAGTWLLNVPTTIGDDDVKISLIKLFNMSMQTDVEFNGSDDLSNAKIGDTLNIKSVLLSNQKQIDDPEFYTNSDITARAFVGDSMGLGDSIKGKSASEVMAQLNSLPNSIEVKMSPANASFIASIPLTGEPGTKAIGVIISSSDFICYDERVIAVSDAGEIIPVKKPDKITLQNGDTTEIPNLTSYCSSDKVSTSISKTNSNILESSIRDNTMELKGIAPGTGIVTIQYTSTLNASVCEVDFLVEVLNTPPKFNQSIYTCLTTVGKAVTFDQVLNDVSDKENDNLSFRIETPPDNSICKAELNGNTLIIYGVKSGSSSFELSVFDGTSYGKATVNVTVEMSFLMKVAIILTIVLGIILFFLMIRFAINKSKRLYIELKDMMIDYKYVKYNLFESFSLNTYLKKKNRTTLAEVFCTALDNASLNMDSSMKLELEELIQKNFSGLILKGSTSVSKGCLLIGREDESVSLNGDMAGAMVSEQLKNTVNAKYHFICNIPDSPLELSFSCGSSTGSDIGFDDAF